MLNWVPGTCITQNGQGFWFAGGHFLDLDRARLFYQWEFALNYLLDDSDAWTPDSVPLVNIEVDGWKVPPQDMEVDDPAFVIKVDTVDAATEIVE